MKQIFSDPSVVVSDSAPEEIKRLWFRHGHPFSKRYSNPNLVSLAALVEHNASEFRGKPAFLYPTRDNGSYSSITWDQFHFMTERLAHRYGELLKAELEHGNITLKQPTVALLGVGISIEYLATQLALQKLNLRVLLLADRNSPDAISGLLERCHAVALFVDARNESTMMTSVRTIPMVDDVSKLVDSVEYASNGITSILRFESGQDPWEQHAFVLHSSGSTGPPKPITHTNRSMMLMSRNYSLFPDFHIKNWYLLFPLYHIAGLVVMLSGLPIGRITSLPPPRWPPSASSLVSSWKQLHSLGNPIECVHCAPNVIEDLHEYLQESRADFTVLSTLKVLQPGGAKLSDSTISSLVKHGVNVKTTYGSTEIGPPLRSIPHTRENPKCYSFRNCYPDDDKIKMEEVGPNLYECIIYKGFGIAAELWEGKDPNEPYRTNDLFTQEPPKSGNYVLQGRRDDILVHSDGNNTSAGKLQLDIQAANPIIKNILAVGHSRRCVGLLVEIKEDAKIPAAEGRESVWDTVQKINLGSPRHSQILKSMIYILPLGQRLPVTPKGNVKRNEAISVFSDAIERMYQNMEEDKKGSMLEINGKSLRSMIRCAVAEVLDLDADTVDISTNFYDLGMDSVAALQLRQLLGASIGRVSTRAIFEHPSVQRLATYFGEENKQAPKEDDFFRVNEVIAKLSTDLSSWPSNTPKLGKMMDGQVVLLTGATGSLGAVLLEKLVTSSVVRKVYVLLRGSDGQLKLNQAFAACGMDFEALEQAGKFEVLDYRMRDPLLGLDAEKYHHLSAEVTMVIHNAWKVDFNQPLETFEAEYLPGTMHLLRFCHATHSKVFAFSSSVSTCWGSVSQQDFQENPVGDNPGAAQKTGYAQSKYIVERISQVASSLPNLKIPIKIFRLGQLTGHSKYGYWNQTEMYPLLFSASSQLNAIPIFPLQTVDWLPVDIAAGAMLDILLDPAAQRSDAGTVLYNIVNPRRISWADLVEMLKEAGLFSEGSQVEEVSMAEWTRRLKALETNNSADQHPALKLLDAFESMAKTADKPSNIFSTEKATAASVTLRNCPPVGKEWMGVYVKRWAESGFVKGLDVDKGLRKGQQGESRLIREGVEVVGRVLIG